MKIESSLYFWKFSFNVLVAFAQNSLFCYLRSLVRKKSAVDKLKPNHHQLTMFWQHLMNMSLFL